MKKLFLFFCVLLSGCTFQTKHRGYVFPENLETQLKSVKTVAQLEEKVGSPQARTIFGDEVWIYYGADENYRGPLPLKYDNKKVLLVWVDEKNVDQFKFLSDKDLPKVSVQEGETDIPAAIELNALEELFNNIGRFSPAGLGQ